MAAKALPPLIFTLELVDVVSELVASFPVSVQQAMEEKQTSNTLHGHLLQIKV
jgi:hypothetical protein